jgi:hypothetical protein
MWLKRRLSRKTVCDVCFSEVEPSSQRCPHCGADFTDEQREYHELSKEDMNRPHPPIIVNENGALSFFRSVNALEGYLEPIDVENDEYVAYDSRGRLVDLAVRRASKKGLLRTADEVVVASLQQSKPSHASELRTELRRFVRQVNPAPDVPEDAPLSALLEVAMQAADVR